MNLWRGLAIDFTIGAPETPLGNKPHTVAKVETKGYARAFHRAFDSKPRGRLR
jgi:hypothetical protein